MIGQPKIFRVFISSTFADMKQERAILLRDAFPKLEKFCEENNAKFQAIDLRWGVNEDAARDQKTLQICFDEIARCQKVSPKPNFLILLGDRYGWQPIPEFIPKDEGLAIQKFLNVEERTIFDHWYKQDFNSNFEHFVLQPKQRLVRLANESNERLKQREYHQWSDTEKELRNLLRHAAESLVFSEQQKQKYFASATHQEIIRGALNPPDDVERPEEHVFAFSRTIKSLSESKNAMEFRDFLDDRVDLTSHDKLKQLKAQLENILQPCCLNEIQKVSQGDFEKNKLEYELSGHFVKYDAEWKNGEQEISDLQKFNDVVHDALKRVIVEQLNNVDKKDENTREALLHRNFKISLTEHFKGREEILKTIQSYILNKIEKRVMAVIGESGSGKSSVMAKAVNLNEGNEGTLVYRFIGTTSASSNIISMLQSVCEEIARNYNVEAKSYVDNDKAWFDINGLSNVLIKCLALATEHKPVLLVLDALDQLSDANNAKALHWLPKELPDHARVIVSALPELEAVLREAYKSNLSSMPVEEAVELLEQWFDFIDRKLTKEQNELVISSYNKCKLPIYLKLAFEKARKWHSYDKTHTLKEDVAGIINEYFDDLEEEHDRDFVTHVVCYMLSGRYQGLAEHEILEILAFDTEYWNLFLQKNAYHKDELCDLKTYLEGTERENGRYMKLPTAVWSRFYHDLKPFLTERDADGVPIIAFFHRQFNEVLSKRYGLTTTGQSIM